MTIVWCCVALWGCDSSCDCLLFGKKSYIISNPCIYQPTFLPTHTFTFTPSPCKENNTTEKNRTQLPHPNIPQHTPTIQEPPTSLPPHVNPQRTMGVSYLPTRGLARTFEGSFESRSRNLRQSQRFERCETGRGEGWIWWMGRDGWMEL